ncbi:MAG: methylenetetrahydrofolate reductase [Chloroflexota bacterium]
MTPGELLSDYSLEITIRDVERLAAARDGIAPQTTVSITFLRGDAAEKVVEAAVAVRQLGFIPVPHISARRMRSTEELAKLLEDLRDAARIDRVLVIAGDSSQPLGPYEDALAVIRSGLLARYGIRNVGITGYPQGHPQVPPESLSRAMKEKLAALTEAGHVAEIITQFSFDADAAAAWVARIRADCVDAPIRLGVAGPATVQSLLRYAARCGVGVSAKVLGNYGVSITRLLSAATPDLMLSRLGKLTEAEAVGRVKLHLYPFGGLEKLTEWLAAMAAAAGRMHGRAPAQDGAAY